jgi:hypothetical protein
MDAIGIQIRHRGLVSSTNDNDVYRLDTLGGPIHLAVEPALVSANLDFRARLYSASGTVLQDIDSNEIAPAYIDLNSSSPGTYYLEIAPVGFGDPQTTGYSSYGSLGQYYVTGSYLPAPGDSTGANPYPTGTPTPTPYPTATPTPTPYPTAIPTPTPVPTATPSPTPTMTPQPTPVPSTAPISKITSPVPYTQVKRNKKFNITVHATDDDRVRRIVVKIGTNVVCTKNVNSPDVTVTCNEDAPNQIGYVNLTATVTDNQGNQTMSSAVIVRVVH